MIENRSCGDGQRKTFLTTRCSGEVWPRLRRLASHNLIGGFYSYIQKSKQALP